MKKILIPLLALGILAAFIILARSVFMTSYSRAAITLPLSKGVHTPPASLEIGNVPEFDSVRMPKTPSEY